MNIEFQLYDRSHDMTLTQAPHTTSPTPYADALKALVWIFIRIDVAHTRRRSQEPNNKNNENSQGRSLESALPHTHSHRLSLSLSLLGKCKGDLFFDSFACCFSINSSARLVSYHFILTQTCIVFFFFACSLVGRSSPGDCFKETC